MMERLHSVRRQRTCIVLAEENGRFIRQVPPMNGEVGRHVLPSGAHETGATAEKAATRVGFKRD